MLAQMRLTWWRETLEKPGADWPAGELLLAGLRDWSDEARVLGALASGWEAMLAEPPIGAADLAALAGARADAVAAIARLGGLPGDASEGQERGYAWALADIALHLSDEKERANALALMRAAEKPLGKAPRILRPVAVLDALAHQAIGRKGGGASSFFTALRVGLFGR